MTDIRPFEPASEYHRLLAALGDPGVPFDTIHELVAGLPTLAFRLLAEANVESVSGSMEIDRLDRAIILVDRPGVAALAHEHAETTQELPSPLCGDQLRRHLVVGSAAAAVTAWAARLPLENEARTAALLHDLGLAVQARERAAALTTAIESSRETGSRLLDHERLHTGTDHCEIAEDLLLGAGIPVSTATAVGFHHDPLSATSAHRYLTILLYAGECLAFRAGFNDLCGNEAPALEDRVLDELRLSTDVLQASVPTLRHEVERRLGSTMTAS